MIRKLPFLVSFLLSCGPATPTANTVSQVSAAALVAYHRDNPRGNAYTGHRIQVRLEPRTFAVEGDSVHYFTGLPGSPPVVVFRCIDRLDADPERHWLIITGICRGPVRDGIRKADRIAFTIHVDECHVTRVEQR